MGEIGVGVPAGVERLREDQYIIFFSIENFDPVDSWYGVVYPSVRTKSRNLKTVGLGGTEGDVCKETVWDLVYTYGFYAIYGVLIANGDVVQVDVVTHSVFRHRRLYKKSCLEVFVLREVG